MGFDAPDAPPPPPLPKLPAAPKIDEAAAARNRTAIDRGRVNRQSLRIEPGVNTPADASGGGLRIY